MEETKHCPYCGEEILAVAKKCKHCGEWLTEQTNAPATALPGNQPKATADVSPVAGAPAIAAPAAVPPTSDDMHVHTFLTPYALVPLCLGILGSVLSLFEPIGDLLSGFTFLILFYAFYEGMKRHAKPIGWPLVLVIIECGIACIAATALVLYPELMEDADEPLTLGEWIFFIPFLIPWAVLVFKLIRNYSGNILRLGEVFLLSFIVGILLFFDSYGVKIVGLLILFAGIFRYLFDFDEVKDNFLKILPFIFSLLIGIIFYIIKTTKSFDIDTLSVIIDILGVFVDCCMFYCFYRLIKKKKA